MQISEVVKRFGDLVVLSALSLEVAQGQVVVIIGASGSGKSTLLRCVSRLEPIDAAAGTITLTAEARTTGPTGV